jgi:hypothetical protein
MKGEDNSTDNKTDQERGCDGVEWINAKQCQIFKMDYVNPPTNIHPEDGNWKVCRNVGRPSTLYAVYNQNPKFYIKLQEGKPKDKIRVSLWLTGKNFYMKDSKLFFKTQP